MYGLSALGDLAELQSKLGVAQTNEWDTSTRSAMAAFQGSRQGELTMNVTGQPDPATLINLDYYDPLESLPRKQAQYLAGDREKPGTFWRDTATISNQVPQWIWLVTGTVFVGVGYYLYRRNTKQAEAI